MDEKDRMRGEDELAGTTIRTHDAVTHDRREETPEAKTRWFQSLPLSERMEMLCAFTDLALTVNPALQEGKDAQPVAGRIQVLSAT
jgi:hypothetical protein